MPAFFDEGPEGLWGLLEVDALHWRPPAVLPEDRQHAVEVGLVVEGNLALDQLPHEQAEAENVACCRALALQEGLGSNVRVRPGLAYLYIHVYIYTYVYIYIYIYLSVCICIDR